MKDIGLLAVDRAFQYDANIQNNSYSPNSQRYILYFCKKQAAMKQLFTERNALREIQIKTDIIDKEKYQMLLKCCNKYYNNLAFDFPFSFNYRTNSISTVNQQDLIRELKYRIPRFHADNYWKETPKRKLGQQKKDPYALLDYIEFMA